MKYIFAIFFTVINCIADTNSAVVFSKHSTDGKELKVVFRSLPFEVTRTTNGNVISISSQMPKKISPSTKWNNIYTIVTTDSAGEHQLVYGTMLKVGDRLGEKIKIVDAQSEGRTGVFLYKSPTAISNQCLFAHLTGKIPTVTNTPVPHLSAGLGHMPSKEELAAWQREQALVDADPIVNEYLIWAPSQREHGELKSARIIGSRASSSLAVEVTIVVGKFQKTQTNCFINDKWIMSESKLVPLDEPK